MSDNEDGDAESPRYSNHESNGDVESPKTDKGSNGDGEDYQSHYKESEPYQEVKDHDKYGNPTYVAYKQRYAYQNATGSKYGRPTYNN